jgi:hypothetical protein
MARGYEPDPDPPLSIEAVVRGSAGSWTRVALDERRSLLDDSLRNGLGVLLPTFVRRCSLSEQTGAVQRIVEQLRETREVHPNLPLLIVVGMQWQGDEREEALRRLQELGDVVARGGVGSYLGLCVPGPGKNRTINASLAVTASLDLLGWFWTDDDAEWSAGCFRRLVTEFLARGCRGAVGAQTTVRAERGEKWTARISWAKKVTTLQRPYPFASCMIVAPSVIAEGIPKRRYSDDGFVFFRLLRPLDSDPYQNFSIVPDAFCRLSTENRPRSVFRRWRRLIYSHLISLSDETPDNARYYFRQVLFYGLWPIGPWDARRGLRLGALRWSIKALYFVWFSAEASLLLTRGIIGRPLRSVRW